MIPNFLLHAPMRFPAGPCETPSEQIIKCVACILIVTFNPNSSWDKVLDMGAGFLPVLLWSPELRQLSSYWTPTIGQMTYRVIDVIRKKVLNSVFLVKKNPLKLSKVRQSGPYYKCGFVFLAFWHFTQNCTGADIRNQWLLSILFKHNIFSIILPEICRDLFFLKD